MKRSNLISALLILTVLISLVTANLGQTLSAAATTVYSPQTRKSSYQTQPKPTAPYPKLNMSEHLLSKPNASLLEQTIYFVPDDYLKPKEYSFNVNPNEKFLAIDGASQSGDLEVSFATKYPNGTTAKTQTTTVTNPMHFETVNPPTGKWNIMATLTDRGETTAFVQAISYQNGTRLVTGMEKGKLNLVSGGAIYFKIPLYSVNDWFYLTVNRLALGHVDIRLRKQESYLTTYRVYSDAASEFFSSKQHTAGTYLLSVINNDRVDVFLQITKPQGIKQPPLSVDQGCLVTSRYEVDHDFFNISLSQTYAWTVLDGAVLYSGTTASLLLISPSLDIIYQGTSSYPSDFKEHWILKPPVGKYVLAIFANGYADVTIKLTSSNNVEQISVPKFDLNCTFVQSGQTTYLNISSSKSYIFLVGTALTQANIRYEMRDSALSSIWSWGPQTGTGFSGIITATKPFYILKIQGQTQSCALVHLRSGGFEDYSIDTPDVSNYYSHFKGDLVTANVTVKPTSNYFFQYAGATSGDVYVAFFDTGYNTRWSRIFSQALENDFRRWRKGIETLPTGNWLQIVISQGSQPIGDKKLVEISSLQTGDESKYITTPYQFTETVDWSNWWQMRIYKVHIGTPNWFGIVSQLMTVNTNYNVHPYAMLYFYDSSLDEQSSSQSLSYNTMFATSFWPHPEQGTWLVVTLGFKHSTQDPLKLSVSLVGEADFYRDWPANLTGTITTFPLTIRNTTYLIEAKSNSTVQSESFSFSELAQEISFTISGQLGTNGYSILVVPKQLAKGPFSVFIDGVPQQGILSIENNTHTAIYFDYEHSSHAVKVVYATPGRCRLEIKSHPSLHGSPDPSYGEHWYEGGIEMLATVNNVTGEWQSTRYRCTGWTGTGAVLPRNGTDTTVAFQLNQHSTLTWNWIIQYRLNVTTDPQGLQAPNTSPSGSWFDNNTLVYLAPQSIHGYSFDHWTIDGINNKEWNVGLRMNLAHSVVAHYKPQPSTLYITVKEEDTDNYIDYANVKSISQPINQSALSGTTNRYGAIRFDSLKAGPYNIEVSKAQYLTETKLIEVTAGESIYETIYMLKLLPGKSALRIYVVDSSGNPLNQTSIVSTSQPNGQPPLTGTTDANGYIVFKNVSIGSYTIEASKSGYVYYKRVIGLSAGETTSVTITLLRIDETGNLVILVEDSDGVPINNVTIVSKLWPNLQLPLNGATNATGFLEFTYIVAGPYTIEATKKGYRRTSVSVTVERQKTTNITIQLIWDQTKPTIEVTISPEKPDTTQTIHFTVTASDDEGGSGIEKITLYIDRAVASEWSGEGTYSYSTGPLFKGNHTFYAVAVDNAGNEARDPVSGVFMFSVVEPPPQTLWMWLAAASIATLITTGVALARKRTRTRKMQSDLVAHTESPR